MRSVNGGRQAGDCSKCPHERDANWISLLSLRRPSEKDVGVRSIRKEVGLEELGRGLRLFGRFLILGLNEKKPRIRADSQIGKTYTDQSLDEAQDVRLNPTDDSISDDIDDGARSAQVGRTMSVSVAGLISKVSGMACGLSSVWTSGARTL